MKDKKRILTGVTTSGTPHIGNLVGAVLPAIEASKSKDTDSFLFLADYHSLIKNLDPELTHSSSFEVAATWLSCGLDPKKVTFYRQSDVPQIMELAWVLGCLTAKGLLNRSHAYKAAVANNDKEGSTDSDRGITMGLFNYPILMAADILMFNADLVPVGNDQKQHLEMTRDIANRFNHHYGKIFTIPEDQISDEAGIIPGLDGRKMSKSYGNVIPIFTDKNNLNKLVKRIKTNSLEPGQPKDTSDCNLFKILKAFGSSQEIEDMRRGYEEGLGWGKIKEVLIEIIDNRLRPFREDYRRIILDRHYLEITLKEGAEKAREVAAPVLRSVRGAVGIKGF